LHCEGLGPIDLAVEAGDCLCLSGPSGAGKTRLLRMLADLDPHQGSCYLDEVSSAQIVPPQWRKQVALLPADSRWWGVTVADHFPDDGVPQLSSIDLPDEAWQWQVDRLSSGERQRLALLRVLANQPKVLLLDEPTANLDARNVERIEALITEYQRSHQAAVIWVSHDAAQIGRVSQRQLRIEQGCLLNAPEAAA
jgi:ABC-type iron transport system FetAB ATPase subunit